MQVLVKFPSRERPGQFIANLKRCIELSTKSDTKYLISLDFTDPKHMMYVDSLVELNNQNVEWHLGYSKNKIHAVNRDMDKSGEWDIVIVVSDDQVPQMKGWDQEISQMMSVHFPDTNGTLWFSDGYQPRINTQCIIGRKLYEKYGYIYHPSYKSLWCDNEFTEVNAPVTYKSELCIFKHEHFSNNPSIRPDAMMRRTESFYHEDQATYIKRKQIKFAI